MRLHGGAAALGWGRATVGALLALGLGTALTACGSAPGAAVAPKAAQAKAGEVRMRVVEDPNATAPVGPGGGRPILLVHGHMGSSSNWVAMMPYLRAQGYQPIAVEFETNGWSDWTFQLLAEQLAVHHQAVMRRHGLKQLDMLCHSLGGLIARQYIKFLGGEPKVGRLVCLGSPHHGVGYAALGPFLVVSQAFRPGSPQIKALNEPDESFGAVQYTNLWSTGDVMEWLPYASGRQEGAFNFKTHKTSHGDMTTDPKLFPHVVRFLQRPLDAVPGPEETIP